MGAEVSAEQVRTEVLGQAMDAVALNDHQAGLLSRPETPGIDSIEEALTLALGLVKPLKNSNRVERECERTIAGWADITATKLRDGELNGPPQVTGRQVATQLRQALSAHDKAKTLQAKSFHLGRIFSIFEAVPENELLRPAVTHNLGSTKTKRVRELLVQWKGMNS